MSRIYEALMKEMKVSAPLQIENSGKPTFLEPDPAEQKAGRAPVCASAEQDSGVAPSSFPLQLDALRERCAKPGWKLHEDYAVLFNTESFDMCAEKFRSLRASLNRLRAKSPIRTVLVTSAVTAEGKSFVSVNLARVIAGQHGRSALLIDADLRSPRLHTTLGAPSSPGLSDYLRGKADEFSIIQMGATENLAFIPAGGRVSNPAELLTGGLAKRLLEKMSVVFDWIIVDAPPTLLASDASLLAASCDGTILVVGAGTTAPNLAQAACQELQGNNLLGVVLNRAEDGTYSADGYYAGSGRIKD